MKVHLINFWDSVRTSYWFVPGLLVLAAIALSFITISIDQQVRLRWIQTVGWFWAGGPEGARGLLSTVAGSMITVAGVVFSITLVALSQASSQFGPRLLSNFMRDTGNQIVLGTFVATFIYCLFVLRTIRSQDDTQFVPFISVTISLVLVLASIGVLIYFFHHVALSIQAPVMIAAVAEDLFHTIDRLLPDCSESDHPEARKQGGRAENDLPQDFDQRAVEVNAQKNGYLQAMDLDGLLKIAERENLTFLLPYRPGHFSARGNVLVKILPGERLEEDTLSLIADAFIIGKQRTHTQDIEFAIEQLVEVAIRALSPSINDTFTAITCIDWLAAALSHLVVKEFPPPYRYGEDGKLRIIFERPATFQGAVNTAFNQIRQNSVNNVAVRIRLLEAIARVLEYVRNEEQREALLRQAEMIERGMAEEAIEKEDREDIEERYQNAVQVTLEGEDNAG